MLDLRYAFRQLLRSPGFTAVALLTLALGMGVNAALFSVFHGVVLQQLPYPDAERLVTIHNRSAGEVASGGRLSRAEFRDYEERQRAFEGMAASDLGRMTLTSTGEGHALAERVKVSRVTPTLFPLLGVRPARGRAFQAGDESAGAMAIISDQLWRTHFGGAEDILSRSVRLNGAAYAIVGVMPAGFGYPEPDMGAWTPIDLRPRDSSDRSDHYLAAIGRLAPGTSAEMARLDLQRVARELHQEAPAAYPADPAWSLGAESLRESQYGHMRLPLGLLMAAAAAVLLIACVNVAVMALLRAVARRREIAIRLAIGASGRNLVRQLLTEAAVLSTLAAIAGIVIAQGAITMVKAVAPPGIPRLQDVGVDGPTALFATGALVLVALMVGLAPAGVALRMKAFAGAFPSTRSSDSRATARVRDVLTVTEIALAAALLICAGLTVRSLQALVGVDLGFATERRFSFKTNLTEAAYPDQARVDAFYEQLTGRLAALPGTESIGAVSYLPLSGEGQSTVAAPADPADARESSEIAVGWGIVRGRYFETMDVALISGRLFSADDRPTSPPVAIVDDELARRLWPTASDAIGKRMRFGSGPSSDTRTVVGVVRHVSHVEPGTPSLPMAYAPQSQVYQRGMYTVIRTTSAPPVLVPAARTELAAVDPSVPMYFAETVAARYDAALALPRFTAGLVSAFSTLALLLAGVGIFGVTGYAVAQRTREFGIRLALGAQRAHVGALVLARVAVLAGVGLGIGTAAGLGLGSLMSGLLFGIEPGDPWTIAVVMGAIGLTAMLASLAPLRHAVRVSPAQTLRSE
jgi:predicted permease